MKRAEHAAPESFFTPRFFSCARVIACFLAPLAGAAGSRAADDRPEARAVVDRALKAMGGEAKLARFRAATWNATGAYHGVGPTVDYRGLWIVHPPYRVRISITGDSRGQKFTRLLVINGDKGWVKLNDSLEVLDPATLLEERERLHANWVASLLPLKSKEFELSLLEEKRIGDRIASGVKVVHSGHRDVSLYFDKQSGLLLQSESRIKDPRGTRDVVQEVRYSDYREVQGLLRAWKIVVSWDQKKQAEAVLSDYQALEKAEDSDFSKPE